MTLGKRLNRGTPTKRVGKIFAVGEAKEKKKARSITWRPRFRSIVVAILRILRAESRFQNVNLRIEPLHCKKLIEKCAPAFST